ncbi:RHS repeat-associated core domain-containing protein [Diaminobutyricibacter sp. McL0618]|uniref:RHS repeat-associated core domain-containing protein n=1 Tax=Leifsonia sp. McL0618 TaxID=3415677 RepID=UPI003CE92820
MERARRLASATLAEVRAAATAQDVRVKAETEVPAPQAEGRISPEKKSTITADDLGASVTFSGNKAPGELSVTVGAAPKVALRSARSESPGGGVVVSDPVEIVATDGKGDSVTSFPPKAVNTRGAGKDGPIVSDVVPGVKLSLKPDRALVSASKVDASTLHIYTRETDGEPWTLLPSYYDAKAGVVRGESDHLSQFVVIGTPFPVPPGPRIVLDPDNDDGRVTTPVPPVSEWGYNQALAAGLKTMFENNCKAVVTITNTGPNMMLSRDIRAGIAAAANPDVTLGIGFNTLDGVAWGGGDTSTGGTQVYSRGGAPDDAVSAYLVGNLPVYTGRPAHNMGNNGNFPGDEFAGLPNAFTHIEPLFMDNNYDRAVIDNGFSHIVDGVFTGLGQYLQSQGFNCTDPVTGGWPSPPTQAELNRWHEIGLHNYQTYGGEPFSFSTGNLIEQEKLFTLPGSGGGATDVTLTYNSQDGRLGRVGAGWTFGLGARAQRFIDGSVMVVRGDGASNVFASDGHGGYNAEPGLNQTLTEPGGGLLKLSATSGESWVFDAADIDGVGELVSHTDANGLTTVLRYGAANPDVSQFVPLAGITDSSGKSIQVSSDALGRVTGFTRPGGAHWGLSYDGAGNLTTLTFPDGTTHTYSYDGSHQLLTATDGLGVTYLKNEYDPSGRVVKQWDADGGVRSLDFSTPGRTSYRDTLGRTSTFEVDAHHRITKITHADGKSVSFTFDSQNNVTSTVDEKGNSTSYTYDAAGNVLSETLPDGAVTKYTYTPTGQVATVTDRGGANGADRTTSYDYDASNRLVAVHQPDGHDVTNRYDAAGNLVSTRKPSGAITSYAHDAAGNVISMTDPTGGVTRYTYDAAGRMLSQTDPLGNITKYTWDARDRVVTATDPAGGVSTYGYDANGNILSSTDQTGGTTKYAWDHRFNLISETDPLGAVTTHSYTSEDVIAKTVDPLGAVTTFASDQQDRIIGTTDPNGGEWKQSYDGTGSVVSSGSPSGAATKITYDAAGRVVSATDRTGAKTTYAYDGVGRMVKTTDADRVSMAYAYDVMDRVTKITDGLGRHADYGYDSDGNLVSVTDRTGQVTTLSYDAAGRMTSVTTPLGAATRFSYDGAGNVIHVTDPLGRTTTTEYTPLGMVASVTNPAGEVTKYAYDAAGRPTTTIDPLGNTTTIAYDLAGRETSSTDATGAITGYEYNAAGNQTTMTDPLGHMTAYHYDPAAQLVSVVEGFKPGAPSSTGVNVKTSYSYDADGYLARLSDPNGHMTSFAYDKAGRVLTETNPLGNKTSYTYTRAGRSASDTNGAGQVTRYGYDKRGDLTKADRAGATASYEYDGEQNLIAMTDPTGVTGWTYDKDGHQTTQIDQKGGRLVNSFDAAGQLTTMKLPTGESIDYTYDRAGRVTSQSSPWGGLTYQWDAGSNLTSMSRSTGVTTNYSYDPMNRVTDIVHQTAKAAAVTPPSTKKPVPSLSQTPKACATVAGYLSNRATPAAGSNALCKPTGTYLNGRTLPTEPNPVADGSALSYSYTYDADGHVSKATRTIGDAQPATSAPTAPGASSSSGAEPARTHSVSYGYDALERLISSQVAGGEKNAYTYDPAGNRTSWKRSSSGAGDLAQSAEYNNANQIVQTTTTGAGGGVATYGYDGAGNRTHQTSNGVTTGYGYDATGKVASVGREGRTTSYGYDGLGRQASATDTTNYGTITTRTVSAGTTPVQQTSSQHGTTTLVYDAVGHVAEQVGKNGSASWDLLDRLGSTVAQSTGGSITQLASYSDWGEQSFETGGWSALAGFTGQASDPSEGLTHFDARGYDAHVASWMSPDSWPGLVAQPKSLSRYSYVEGDPIRYLDPDGHRLSDPSADARFNSPTFWIDQQREAEANRVEQERVAAAYASAHGGTYRPVPPNPPGPIPVFDPKTGKPIDYSKPHQRHVDTNTNAFFQEPWVGVLSNILGTLGTVAGILGWIPLPIPGWPVIMKVVGAISTGISTLLGCLSEGLSKLCIMSVIVSLVSYAVIGLPSVVVSMAKAVGAKLADFTVEALTRGPGYFSNAMDLANTIIGWGCAAQPSRCA